MKMKCPRCKKEHDGVTKTCVPCKEQKKEYIAQNADKIKKQVREYQERNAEQIKEYKKEYRAQNVEKIKEKMKEYRAENADKIKEQARDYRATIHKKFLDVKYGAHQRNINFEISEEFVGQLTDQECIYCGQETTDTCRNGVDRLDNTNGYVEYNCISCCGSCNVMKRCLDPLTFVERCAQVSLYNGFGGAVCEFWGDIKGSTYANYKRMMKSRNKEFQLTKDQYDDLRQGNCTYCGRTCTESHMNGIDCIDSSRGYIINNCVSCCGDCNFAKGTMTKDDFINKCVTIASKNHIFPDIPRCVKMICQNRPK
jgi:hypothetical protein